ncbi:hypothetical protein KB559_10925 [Paenibacillus sp. Marseille-P2973]|uniref:hypothetical protein n=1 Tax=Paenibacillus sp. Marseille-P2973 TaxID=1871032 RepID=UPI001B367EA6|nr:hypothetical protein [Paenibacillus sp. Marseille-P2973]MBQ4899349.1 hypothetical protein [Paenibacillus sp. Marseille-P2973]
MSFETEIKDYEDAATGELLSIAELQFSLVSRDTLHHSELSPGDLVRVNELDRAFIERAEEVRDFIAGYGDADAIFVEKPPQFWWWHIARIASGQMLVDLVHRTVKYKEIEYKY